MIKINWMLPGFGAAEARGSRSKRLWSSRRRIKHVLVMATSTFVSTLNVLNTIYI
jgi:hypothetical protein